MKGIPELYILCKHIAVNSQCAKYKPDWPSLNGLMSHIELFLNNFCLCFSAARCKGKPH